MTDTPKDPATSDAERTGAWAKVQALLDQANAAVVAWQNKFATVGIRIAEPPEIPDTPAHRAGQAKRQRHADAIASGDITEKDIAIERQAEFAERFAKFPDTDRALLNDWGTRQEVRTGHPLGVWTRHAMPWPLVYLAGIYGEEVEHWPTSLSNDDRGVLAALDRGSRGILHMRPLTDTIAAKAERPQFLFAHPNHASHLDAATKAHAARVAAAKPTK
jgi:L-fucose isomerase-like protein